MSCEKPCEPGTPRWIAHGAIGLVKAALGVGQATQAVIEARRNVCRDCTHSRKHPLLKTSTGLPLVSYCRKCLCSLRAKTTLATEACPDGRWAES